MGENYKLPKLNLLVIGKTGVGKSTLLNSLFGENLALTGEGEPITQKIHKFEPEGFPISIYDTPGMELDGKHSAENLLDEIIGQIASIDLKRKRARAVVTGAAGTAALTGAAPIPFSDAAILVPTQVSMLAGITAIFGLPLGESALASIVSATIGTAGTTVLGKTVVANLVKMIPGAGTVVGAVISGTTAATLTGALGEAYIAIMTRVASGDMSFAELTSSKGMEELRREFEKQLRMSRS